MQVLTNQTEKASLMSQWFDDILLDVIRVDGLEPAERPIVEPPVEEPPVEEPPAVEPPVEEPPVVEPPVVGKWTYCRV